MAFDRKRKSGNPVTETVEHLGDNRDVPKLSKSRPINGFGTAVPPPETNSSISTVGRSAPRFEVEGRTYMFQLTNGQLAFEVTDDEDGINTTKKVKKD